MESLPVSISYLHTMIRVTDLDATLTFFSLLGLEETHRKESEAGRFTLVFLAAPGQGDDVLRRTSHGRRQ